MCIRDSFAIRPSTRRLPHCAGVMQFTCSRIHSLTNEKSSGRARQGAKSTSARNGEAFAQFAHLARTRCSGCFGLSDHPRTCGPCDASVGARNFFDENYQRHVPRGSQQIITKQGLNVPILVVLAGRLGTSRFHSCQADLIIHAKACCSSRGLNEMHSRTPTRAYPIKTNRP